MFDATIKILVVDDMMTMRKLVKKSLMQMGYNNIEEAADGQLGWAKLQETNDFRLVVSDWNMPNCTGLDLLKRVRADARFRELPFVLLTAESEVAQVKEAMAAGVDNYVLKPFTFESLKEKLEQVYKKRNAA